MPYLSEGCSEATVDEEALRKLIEFGDDYGSAIGHKFLNSLNRKVNKGDAPRSPKKSSKSSLINHGQRLYSFSNESDSDSEDLHHVIEEAKKALHFARVTFKKGQAGDFFTSAEHVELLATCGTHLRCLYTISEHIENEGNGINFSKEDLEELYFLIEEWKYLQRNIKMLNAGEEFVKKKFISAQKSIDDLFREMSELEAYKDVVVEHFNSFDEFKEKISHLQMVLTTLQSTKEKLLAVNVEVHRFMTNHGGDLDYKDCTLKENVTELYQRWDDIYENNEKQLTALQIICNKWKIYKDKVRTLRYNLKYIESITPDCDKESNTCDVNETDGLKTSLAKSFSDVQKDAAILQEFLKGGATWNSIDLELQDLAERINKYTRTQLLSRRPNRVLALLDDDPDDQFEDAMQLLEQGSRDSSLDSSHQVKQLDNPDSKPKKKPSRFWRMIRIAVPVQLAVVLLFCLACCLEPNCCDMLNNFNFSLAPHLRYWRGPPPT